MHRGKRGAFDWGGVAAVERLARALADPRTGPRRGTGSLRVRRETAFLPAGCPAGGGGGQRACAASFCCQRVRADVVVGWN